MTEDAINRSNTILYCRRWAATVAFYRDALALPVHLATDWFVEFQVAGGAFVSIADERRASVKSGGGGGITLSFRVENADAWHRRLEGRGVALGRIRHHWGARAFFLRDPEGHRIEIWAAATEAPGDADGIS
jgi:catechol 2,3-dioxygenase-like lactoylglutathione lyase family enzyme